MSVQVRYRREAASFLSSFVGAQGELLIDTTNNRVQVHDGTTPGGFPAAKLSEVVTNVRTPVVDANYTVQIGDRNVAYTSLTAARTVTLPAASAYPTGTQLIVFDETGNCSSSRTITIARVGSDTINGAAGASIAAAYGYLAFESNGTSRWTIVDQIATGGSSASRTSVADAAYTALTTDRIIAYTSLTAARTVTLPAASAYPTGTRLLVLDESGACSATRTITLARAGSDTINGAASAVISSAYGYVEVQTNGSTKWTVSDQSSATTGPQSNFAATTPPGATNDSSQGYSVGSLWYRSDTGDTWRCRNATAGGAAWVRIDQAEFFGFTAGNWFLPWGLGSAANGTAHGANTIRLFPMAIKQRVTLSALGLYVRTSSVGGSFQIAVYASDPTSKRWTGSPLASTGSLTTTTVTQVNGSVSVQLEPGLYWVATNCDNATAAAMAIANSVWLAGELIGSASQANISAFQTSLHFTVTQTFGTWPDLTGVAGTETANSSNYMPVIHLQVGSVP